MARADFYLIAKPRFRNEPLRLVCELARRAFEAEQPALILVRDEAQAEELDDLLWSFDPDSYLPHQIAGVAEVEDDEVTEFLVVPPGVETPSRPLVINLRDAAATGEFVRVLEVVPADASAREPLRARWREYQQRGFELAKHDM